MDDDNALLHFFSLKRIIFIDRNKLSIEIIT